MKIGSLALVFQLKERTEETSDPEAERQWFRRKVLRKATDQIKDSVRYLAEHEEIHLTKRHRLLGRHTLTTTIASISQKVWRMGFNDSSPRRCPIEAPKSAFVSRSETYFFTLEGNVCWGNIGHMLGFTISCGRRYDQDRGLRIVRPLPSFWIQIPRHGRATMGGRETYLMIGVVPIRQGQISSPAPRCQRHGIVCRQ